MTETKKKAEPNAEDSAKLAAVITGMKVWLHLIDEGYATTVVGSLYEQASRQDTLSILNPGYDLKRSELLRQQAKALQNLVDCVAGLKRCDELKTAIGDTADHNEKINDLFI